MKFSFCMILSMLCLFGCSNDKNAETQEVSISSFKNISIDEFLNSSNNSALRSISKKEYWAKAFGKAKINSKGIYFTKSNEIKNAMNIFFYSRKIGVVGPSATLKIGPTDQIARIKPLVPLKLNPKSTWARLIKEHGYGVSDMYYLPNGTKSIDLFFFSKKLGSLSLNSSGKFQKDDVYSVYRNKPQKLDSKNSWYKYFSSYGVKNLYFTRTDVKGKLDIYFKDILVTTVGLKKDGFDGPKAQASKVGPKILSLKGKHPLFQK